MSSNAASWPSRDRTERLRYLSFTREERIVNLIVALLGLYGPGYATPITISEKDVTLPEICNEIGVKSGLKIDLPHELWNYKVTVFVKDMKARALLDKLANLYDLDAAVLDGRYELKLGLPTKKAFENYVHAEFLLRMKLVLAKLDALAKLTQKPFGDPSAAKTGQDARGADRWAAGHIDQPKYYAAGMFERATLAIHPELARDPEEWANVLSNPIVNVFWVGSTPPLAPGHGANIFAKNFLDDNSKEIAGTAVAISSYETTAEFVVTSIPGKGSTEDLLDRPFLYAHPPQGLAKMPFATHLKEWQTAVDPNRLGEPVKNPKPPDDPGYFDGRISLSEKLQNLHNLCGTQIVATSFRTPALEQHTPDTASPGDLLNDLTGKEQAFLRWDDDCLMVRHPAYWILECSEVSEPVMREAEAIATKRPLTLFEYGGLARLMAPSSDDEPPWHHMGIRDPINANVGGAIPRSFERLPGGRGFLSRFDPEPLEKAYPILAVLGWLSPADRDRFANGEKLDAEGYTGEASPTIGAYSGLIVKGKSISPPPPPNQSIEYRPNGSAGAQPLPDYAADMAPLFPATLTIEFLTPMERFGYPHVDPPGIKNARATRLWLENADGDTYQLYLGTSLGTVATFEFTIHSNSR